MNESTPSVMLASQHLERLDAVSRKMEAKWGVRRLEKCVSAELSQKWDKQWAKLQDAVSRCEWQEAAELSQGCIRGWEALEKAAGALGYSPDIGQSLECQLPSGGVLRVCASALDAKRPVPEGYVVVTMAEVAALVDKHSLTTVIAENNKNEVQGVDVPRLSAEFWKTGDSVPF